MALSTTVETDWKIIVSDAYCRVEHVSLVRKDYISFHVRYYAASESVPFFNEKVISCQFTLEGPNPIKQAYHFLKTLPEFADATDC